MAGVSLLSPGIKVPSDLSLISKEFLFQVEHITLTTIAGPKIKPFRPARKRIEVSVGESVRIIRELQEYSQNEIAKLTGIPQATLSAIENDRVRLGVERAKILARALKCHPAVLVFPGWEVTEESAA